MILLQDSETCRQARLILRELIKGDKSRAQLWGSLVDNQLDDVDLRFLLPPLANEGYIEESEGMWHILDKGVKYMQTYDRMIMESIEGYPYRQKKSKEDENLILQKQSFKWTKISVIVSILIALIGWIAPRLDGVIAAILTLFHE
uniref:Uncharacterized protein n=1 Tax=Siphoviridae sp. ctOXk3 TaxID=2827861 RepID=A0A8S5SYH4_9CAUD|nr:MAG TPA: hypothetical protein [Siphoviridae sp. ctOXk3]